MLYRMTSVTAHTGASLQVWSVWQLITCVMCTRKCVRPKGGSKAKHFFSGEITK